MQYVYVKSLSKTLFGIEPDDVGFIHDRTNLEGNQVEVFFLRVNKLIKIDSNIIDFFEISQTGDLYDYKVCDRCFKRLETSTRFENNRHKKDNLITKRPSCRICRKLKDGVSISSEDRRKWNEKRPNDFTSFTCPICNKTTIVGISKVVLDHDHSTGKVRGYLCESCNTGIGRFDDDPEIVSRAIEWLTNH